MGDYGEALLNTKVHHENCPGCRVNRIKEAERGTPFLNVFSIWAVILCSSLPISLLFPFLYFMVRDFHITEQVEDIGFYAGFVGSSFMVGRFLTSYLWGMAADRYGRKPVILCGVGSIVLFNGLFGLSNSFWMAVITRFILGCFNGLLGTIKAYASELFREDHQALAMSVVGTSWGIGLIIGPAIGGYLAQPAEKYPNTFSKDSLFGRFPYFLPCLCISVFAFVVFIASFWLPETIHKHPLEEIEKGFDTSDDLEVSDTETKKKRISTSRMSLFKNWSLMSTVIIYGFYSLHEISYTEIFSLWANSPRSLGGLGFSSEDVGQVLAISGFILLFSQLCIFPKLEKLFGPIHVARLASALTIPLLMCYPLIAMLTGFTLKFVINVASLLKNALSLTIVTGIAILQNNSVPRCQRGAANGISLTAMSLFKAIGPAAGGAIFSWAQKRQHASFLPGDSMVFFFLCLLVLLLVILTYEPFLPKSCAKPYDEIERENVKTVG
ncbi:hypothetical protein AMTRI_Chr01g127770 [Amborella trichopoda]